ncbi:MAG: hypothetical protein M1826_006773 [Phylliscum demangeonii]|nr:MAG: hypothetical protein M1826_006773 [Phylliscum demangeonii]
MPGTPMDLPPRAARFQGHEGGKAPPGSYGSLASYDTAHSQQPPPEEASGPSMSTGERNERTLSKRSSATSSLRRVRTTTTSTVPERAPPITRKPSMARRSISQVQGPYRRQGFSTDDDAAEVEARLAQQQTSASSMMSGGRGTIRRRPSAIRRWGTVAGGVLRRVDSAREPAEDDPPRRGPRPGDDSGEDDPGESAEEGTIRPDDGGPGDGGEDQAPTDHVDEDDDDDDDADDSDAESFTLKDRQDAINESHPFGIRVWKPALYKKNRSVQKSAEGDIHSSPGGRVSNVLFFCNILWTLFFGWWLAAATLVAAGVCLVGGVSASCLDYGRVLLSLARYLFYPFGKFVKLQQDEAYADEDEGEGRSISEYEQWQTGDLEDGRLIFGPHAGESLVGRRRPSIESASEHDSLLGRTWRGHDGGPAGARSKRRLFGRGQWNAGRVIFFVLFYGLIAPLLLFASAICWLLVFWIPMGKVTILLVSHLRRHPLALSFHSEGAYSRAPDSPSSSILLCTYRAVGLKYWKYTIDGTNIFLINLMSIVLFTIFDYWVLDHSLHLTIGLTHPAVLFLLSLVSVIPLAYFVGQAVASISAQSSMGVGAAINAFFSTLVEVYLYCIALNEGKAQLVEGSIIGSIFAGILFLPGLSMCFGALKRKTQRFNAKSAGVTSTMLLFAVLAAFGPTLFYQIYGTHELNCQVCVGTEDAPSGRDCRRCHFSQVPAVTDRFFNDVVRPFCTFSAVLLFLSYIIGLWFTLRTHAAVIWNTEVDEKKAVFSEPTVLGDHADGRAPLVAALNGGLVRAPSGAGAGSEATPPHPHPHPHSHPHHQHPHHRASVRDSQLYKRILGQSLKHSGLAPRRSVGDGSRANSFVGSILAGPSHSHSHSPSQPAAGPATSAAFPSRLPGLTEEESLVIAREVAEVAATAAAVAAADAAADPDKVVAAAHRLARVESGTRSGAGPARDDGGGGGEDGATVEASGSVMGGGPDHGDGGGDGGHDAPNWSRRKSFIILLGATLLYAVIAEVLVSTVDVVLASVRVDEKFLGFTLFALVPNTTEFLNAISFAMNGNIALSMEIGSAYALQVCLLQIPALVLYSTLRARFGVSDGGGGQHDLLAHTFTLIFPQWDMVTVILCVFLLSYMYGEGKSNYFKGSILLLSYLVVGTGFFLAGLPAVPVREGGSGSGSGGGSGGGDGVGGGETFYMAGRRAGGAW